MRIKTSDLIGPALCYAVAAAQGYDPQVKVKDGRARITYSNPKPGTPCPAFDTDPAQAWPIIDREGICIGGHGKERIAFHPTIDIDGVVMKDYFGPTGLIAAMRCFIASRLGDEVDVPEELMS